MTDSTGILIFPDVEILDFTGPYEVFSITQLNEESTLKNQYSYPTNNTRCV